MASVTVPTRDDRHLRLGPLDDAPHVGEHGGAVAARADDERHGLMLAAGCVAGA